MVITDDRLTPPAAPELLARARAGDADGFCLLIEPLQARLLRQAAALTGDLNLAEDIVSETLIEAWKSFPRYNESCQLSTWLYAILLHRYQKSVRRARSRPIALAWLSLFETRDLSQKQENIPAPELSPAEATARNETFTQLRQCIERLSKKHARVILLRFFEDAPLPDMAAVLGCSVGTVKSRLHHALEKLRKMKMNLPDLKGDTQV
ncbi:MAG TPA: sigma-70 family RNA polymerase sigma factor [Candidatus Limnocylindrales bacterium]|nr:sigma-70 family RNA polymerase sigma factor [Candidatus Limnocylindrales bacterium]